MDYAMLAPLDSKVKAGDVQVVRDNGTYALLEHSSGEVFYVALKGNIFLATLSSDAAKLVYGEAVGSPTKLQVQRVRI